MEAFNRNSASKIIEAAIAAGTLELHGSKTAADEASAERLARIDAKYLVTLVTALVIAPEESGHP